MIFFLNCVCMHSLFCPMWYMLWLYSCNWVISWLFNQSEMWMEVLLLFIYSESTNNSVDQLKCLYESHKLTVAKSTNKMWIVFLSFCLWCSWCYQNHVNILFHWEDVDIKTQWFKLSFIFMNQCIGADSLPKIIVFLQTSKYL